MTSPITDAVLKSGLLTKEQIDEFRRWKAPIDIPQRTPENVQSIEDVAQVIELALSSEGFVISRDTDLDILQHYLKTQKTGVLHIELETYDIMQESVADMEISYGMTPMNEYILPWTDESIYDELTSALTYLDTGSGRVSFTDVRELFLGQNKAFVICKPVITSPRIPALTSGEDHGSHNPS